MKELRNKIAALLYYYGAIVAHIEDIGEEPPKEVQDAIKHYYDCKDVILNEITKDQHEA
jgi:hypothetical protein